MEKLVDAVVSALMLSNLIVIIVCNNSECSVPSVHSS